MCLKNIFIINILDLMLVFIIYFQLFMDRLITIQTNIIMMLLLFNLIIIIIQFIMYNQ